MTISTGEVKATDSGAFVVSGLVITDPDAIEFLGSLEAAERLNCNSSDSGIIQTNWKVSDQVCRDLHQLRRTS